MQGENRSRDFVSFILFFTITFIASVAIIPYAVSSKTAISLVSSSLMATYSIPLSSNSVPLLLPRRVLESSCSGMPNKTYKFERMWPFLPQPWYFDFPSCIATDDKGFVYVADTVNNRIQKFTPEGGFITKWGSKGSENGQFASPNGISVDSSGFIYVADTANDRIQKFTPEGGFITKWGSKGSGDGQFDLPFCIAVDSSGFIYVADTANNRIQKFTPEGGFITKWGSKGSGDGQFDLPFCIAVDSSGSIYVAGFYNHRIQKFTSEGVFITKWGSWGSGDGQFASPRGISVDSSGFIYVADAANDRIQKFTPEGGFITKWGSKGSGDGQFILPLDIAVENSGYVYVADSSNDRIQKFTPEGGFVTKWNSWGTGNGQFDWPYGIAVDSSGFVYMADAFNDRIQKFTPEGGFITIWGSSGSGDGQFDTPFGIAVDSNGFVYVADFDNHRIQKFTSEGGFIAKWGSYGTGDGQFWYPHGISVDSSGFIYIADTNNNRIQKFSQKGEFVTKWGSKGSGNGQFYIPHGIAVDSSGFVYVADTTNNCVQKFTPEGEFITKFGQLGSDPGGLNGPSGIAISPDGRVYVTDSNNNRIQVFNNIIPERIQKAIIVAGGGPYPGNNLWDATQMCANFAYRALTYRGFTKDTIYYLSSNTTLDLDNNGLPDDVDSYADTNSLHHGITKWALDPNGEADPNCYVKDVILYLVDHGGHEAFRINPYEVLSAQDLSTWLNTLQEGISGNVILIYDACSSGSFLPHLAAEENRILIASASEKEQAYFITQGSVSFSKFFWTHIFNAESIGTAFEGAKEVIHFAKEEQNPILEDNGDLYDPNDGVLAKNTYIGLNIPISGEIPMISSAGVSPYKLTHNKSSATLYASGVEDTDGISSVKAVIWPPNYRQVSSSNPVWALPSLDLKPVDPNNPIDPNIPSKPNTYAETYDNFTQTGTYYIVIYAKDRLGNTSVPWITHVNVNTPLRRRAIIIAGDSEALSSAIDKNASLAYRALLSQGYTHEDIHLIAPLGTIRKRDIPASLFFDTNLSDPNLVDSSSTYENIEEALTTWAGQNTLDLLLYLTGEGEQEGFRINRKELLSASDLDLWLDHIQETNVPVTLICDASCSGDFIMDLTPPPERQRILISSTFCGERAHFPFEGNLSFSAIFWPQIINGANIRDAFIHAYDALGITFDHTQAPVLDDTGDGVFTSGEDGRVARKLTIGPGIMLAGDAPLIGSVSPEQTLEGETKAIIRAKDVTTTNHIERVFAVITPPWYTGKGSDPLIELELLPTGEGSYEGAYEGFSSEGTYNVSVYVMDENEISLPKKTTVHRYHDNDTRSQATVILVTPQRHNFHDSDDEDWLKFYGIEGETYCIDANNAGEYCDPVLELYDINSPSPLISRNYGFEGEGEFMSWECPHDGVYYVRITNFTPYFGEGTGYTITVHYPEGFNCIIRGKIRDDHWGFHIETPNIETGGEYSGIPGTALSSDNGSYLLLHTREACTVTASASGYKPKSKGITDSDFMKRDHNTIVRDFDLEPDQDNPAILLSPGLNLFACPFNAPQGYTSSDLAGYLGKQDGISNVKVLRYILTTGTYECTVYDNSGFPSGQDFSIENGEGYLLYLEMEKEMERRIALPGVQSFSLSLEEGLNIISFPCIPSGYTSHDLLIHLGSPDDIWSIQRFDKVKGAFEKTYYNFGRPSGDNYEIVKDEGYIVQMKTKKHVECPN